MPKPPVLGDRQQLIEVVARWDDAPPPLADPEGTNSDKPAKGAWTQTTYLHELPQPHPEVLG